jgi:hypothetical protein
MGKLLRVSNREITFWRAQTLDNPRPYLREISYFAARDLYTLKTHTLQIVVRVITGRQISHFTCMLPGSMDYFSSAHILPDKGPGF